MPNPLAPPRHVRSDAAGTDHKGCHSLQLDHAVIAALPSLVGPVRDEVIQIARQCQQHGEAVVGDSSGRERLRVGHDHVALDEFRVQVGLDTGTGNLHPLQLLCGLNQCKRWIADDGIRIGSLSKQVGIPAAAVRDVRDSDVGWAAGAQFGNKIYRLADDDHLQIGGLQCQRDDRKQGCE